MNKQFWKAVLMRAWHAVWETASATLPATVVITPAMIEHFDKSIFIAIAAWFGTALLAGFVSIVKSLAVGVPEATCAEYTSVTAEEPSDSYRVERMTDEELATEREAMGGDADV